MPAESPLAARVREYLERSAEVKRAAATACAADIARAAELVVACYARGGKVLFCGNGGSAADCQHLAAELV
ncbi:MAG: SIS domain-containing protein, partial [Gemmatimonadetes bacterium]|nr:SIS domain-containing protein [Gemmatimonadota bacterium]